MFAGTDVAFSALCPACMAKALAFDARFSATGALEVYRPAVAVCLDCETREKARRFHDHAARKGTDTP